MNERDYCSSRYSLGFSLYANPFWYSVFLGLVFMVIVYFLPRGVTGLVEDAWEALRDVAGVWTQGVARQGPFLADGTPDAGLAWT